MSREKTVLKIQALERFLREQGVMAGLESVEKLAGDGSTRSYHRLTLTRGSLVLMVSPDREENSGFLGIAAHLSQCGIRVPQVLGHSAEEGWILLEDLGDLNLLDCVLKAGSDVERLELLTPVVKLLSKMCVEGAEGFSLATGFSPSHYNAALMVEEEGLYFLREFVTGVLEVEFGRAEIVAEIEGLARWAQEALSGRQGEFFLHRDFQSRNLMCKNGEWVVIDFQGGRPGPLAYDVAAFIFDPYMANSLAVREELVSRYREFLASYPGVDLETFDRTLGPVGAFRIMQALGAYGKLGHRFGKPGFLEHSGAALEHLEWFFQRCALTEPEVKTQALLALTRQCRLKWGAR